jgi:thioredoxin 1
LNAARRRFSPDASRRWFLQERLNVAHPTHFQRIPPPHCHFCIGEPPVSENIVHITDDTFEAEVLKAEQPVLVDYWAEWCGPCRMIGPILDELAVEYGDRVKVCKLNVDENQNTPPKYGIRGIPTLMLFRNGNVEATKVGAQSKSQLTAFLDSNLR